MSRTASLVLAAAAALAVVGVRGASSPPQGLPLILIPQGVTYHQVDGAPVFLLREGSVVTGFLGRSTAPGEEPIVYCPREDAFVAPTDMSLWTRRGEWVAGSARRDLDRVSVDVDSVRLVAHIDPSEVTVAMGRSRGEISGEAGERYSLFRAGNAFAQFCQNPIPPVPAPTATPS